MSGEGSQREDMKYTVHFHNGASARYDSFEKLPGAVLRVEDWDTGRGLMLSPSYWDSVEWDL